MKYIFILMTVFIIGCKSENKNNPFKLEIITKELKYKKVAINEYQKYIVANGVPPHEATTVITYKLKNTSNKTYYFNITDIDNQFNNEHIKIGKAYIDIYDDESKYLKPKISHPSIGETPTAWFVKESLGYSGKRVHVNNSDNFIIHPNETLYFEFFVVLPFGHLLEDNNYWLELNPEKKYSAAIVMRSDSTKYKEIISRTDLRTIKENGYEVFNGIIKSKNKIPLVAR